MQLPIEISKLPEWVNWLAQDADGAWWGYSVEPLEYDKGWYENELGERIFLLKTDTNPEWKNSLLKITDNIAENTSNG